MELLDRATELQVLNTTLERVLRGEGAVIALLGEAGVGKSSLAREFLDIAGSGHRVIRGFCDDLGIAEPLGVLRDLAREMMLDLPEDPVEPGERLRAFSAVFEDITKSNVPTLLFVEDVHWADDATVEFLRFMTRRISGTQIMLILTARSDETRGRSNVRRVLGDAAAQDVQRLDLGPLSEATVTRLAKQAGLDPEKLNQVTAGNAFFVTELLESGVEAYSATVQDAVLARADRLEPNVRAVLDAAAIFPRHAEPKHLTLVLQTHEIDEALEACVDQGFLVPDGRAYAFRHVLSRLAVLSGIKAVRRRALNGRLLEHLLVEGETTLSRLLYHAREAGNDDEVRRLSAEAAEDALRLGAHREARDYFRVAVEARGPEATADLLEQAAYASYLVGVDPDAIEFQNRALAIYESEGDWLRYGNGLRLRSRFHWSAGAFEPSRQDAEAAVKGLSEFRGPELAMAYSNAAQVHMLNREYQMVGEPAQAAIDLAEELGQPAILSHALNNLACALQFTDPARARRDMDRSLRIALEIGHVDHAARAFVNATYVEMYLGRFDAAKAFATRGIFYCKTNELDGSLVYLTGALSLAELGLGELAAAGRNARAAIARANSYDVGLYRHSGSVALLRYQVRSGITLDPDEIAYLDSFRSDGSEVQRLIPFAECMAEQTWMTGEGLENSIDLLQKAIEWAPTPEIAQTAHVWLKRLDPGRVSPDCSGFLDCYRFEMQGDTEAADEDWAARAAPYERALCLAQGKQKSRQRAAEIFEGLGAVAAARRVRATVNRVGTQRVSNPRASTRSNPAGLTRRQIDVLKCLQDGLSNADIADRLFISPKTVDHHVSAILAKLTVRTRAEAATKAKNWDLEP